MSELERAGRANAQAAADGAKRLLAELVARRLRTAFIGAMARFEEHIGRTLWGHGLPEAELSENQAAWRAVWEKCRAEVLTHGNAQVRAAEADFQPFDVKRAAQKLVLVAPPPGGPHG